VQTWNDLILATWSGSDAPAVVTPDLHWSGKELLQRAGGAATWLDELGVGSHEYVPAIVDESPAAIALVAGATLSGRVPAPLGTKLPASDLAEALLGLGSKLVITDPHVEQVARDAARLAGADVVTLELPSPTEPRTERCDPDAPALVVHTSGTTGRPKPVVATHRRLVGRIGKSAAALELGAGDRYCSASPFSHTAGVAMVYTVLGVGASVIPQDWFSIENWRLAGELDVTCCLLVPTMIDILLEAGALSDARPRVLQYGAAPIDPRTLRDALEQLPDTRFVQIFGQTEVSPITALSHDDHLRALAGEPELLRTVGRPVPGVELRFDQPDGEEIGEVLVRSDHCFVTDADGWRRTGDLGAINEEGYLSLHGRTNDRIVRGGENVYPAEVEGALATHPAVRDVAVVGIPDRRWGEIVKAVVVTNAGSPQPTVASLKSHARQLIAHFKVPTVIEFVDALPRTPSGKVLRRQLIASDDS